MGNGKPVGHGMECPAGGSGRLSGTQNRSIALGMKEIFIWSICSGPTHSDASDLDLEPELNCQSVYKSLWILWCSLPVQKVHWDTILPLM